MSDEERPSLAEPQRFDCISSRFIYMEKILISDCSITASNINVVQHAHTNDVTIIDI